MVEPQPRPVCLILSRSEVEAILGPLLAEPAGSDRDCTWRYTRVGIDGKPRDWPLELKISWRGGYAGLRDEAKMTGQIVGSLLGQQAKEAEHIAGPWDDALETFDFLAVKRDVLVRVDVRTIGRPMAEKFVAAVMQKL